jgi:ribosomal protein S18 acetylase RimI-like enzyme
MGIRMAESCDRDDVSRLHVMAGPNVFKYFFACDEERAVAINRVLFDVPDTFSSMQYYHVCGSLGVVQGAIGMFPGKNHEAMNRNVGRHIRDIIGITGYCALPKMLLRGRLGRRMPALGDDELYIEALAVYPEYRGRGLSSAMLKYAFGESTRLGLPLLSLYAEINNENAIAIYRSKGFRVEDTLELPRRYRKHNLFGFHKMIATV